MKPEGIVCPYCDYVHAEWCDYVEVGDMEGEFPLDCEDCHKIFHVAFKTNVEFTSSEIDYPNPNYDDRDPDEDDF